MPSGGAGKTSRPNVATGYDVDVEKDVDAPRGPVVIEAG